MQWNSSGKKKFGMGCLIALALAAVIGGLSGIRLYSAIKEAGGWDPFVRRKSAEYMRLAINEAVEMLPLNTPEKQTITAPIAGLSERMAKGEVTPQQSRLIVAATYRSPLPEAVLALIFQRKYVKTDQADARLTVNRFVRGILSGKISPDQAGKFTALLLTDPRALERLRQTEDRRDSDPARELKIKEEISPEDVIKCIELMKIAADQAAIPFSRTDLNFTPTIDAVIVRGTVTSGKH